MKQRCKILGLMVVMFAMVMAVGVVGTVDTASAKTVKAKTLKFKKKKVTLKVGDKKTLKVKVKPKKAKLTFKSNKKKVATVSKKGVVKGKKKGTAKITVKSGKKKAVCKVKVKQTYSISSISVVNSKVVRVTLDNAKALSVSDFALAKKSTGDGKNYRSLSIASVNNTGNKVYDLVLSTNYDADSDANYIVDGDYVKVTINKLNGTSSKEAVYYASTTPENVYIGGVTGDKISKYVYFDASYKGYLNNVKVTGLPSGLTATVYSNAVLIKGRPTAVSNGTVATMTATDELGKALTQKIYFYIGSDSKIVAYIPTEGHTILANDTSTKYFEIYAYGGSGTYSYALTNTSNKFITISGEDIRFYNYYDESGVRQYMSAGNYTVGYTVTDTDNSSIKASGSLSVKAINGVTISGKVTAADNTSVTDAYVYASFKDTTNSYYDTSFYGYVQEKDDTKNQRKAGYYYMTVYPSMAYNISAEYNGAESGKTNYNPGTTNQTLNFSLPLYKVTFNLPSNFDVTDDGMFIEGLSTTKTTYSNTIYLKKDTYKIDDTYYVTTEGESEKYKLSASFTVNGNITVNVTSSKVTA